VVAFCYCSCKFKSSPTNTRAQLQQKLVEKYKKDTIGFGKLFSSIKVAKGDTICDIAGGWGYSSAIVANYLPEVIFYEEDIRKNICNKKRFKQTFDLLDSKARIDNYRFFIGKEKKIPFQDKFFKTVTVFISIHEFTYKDEMLAEMKRIMRDDGRLYIYETVYKNTPEIDSFCKYTYLSETELLNLVIENGFGIMPEETNNNRDTAQNLLGTLLECYKLH
jgi:ubiquinone/menaquinone biosynthesis C-methylase UbiE